MSALPVKERIAVNVFETLASVKEDNGYHYSLDVERPKRRGNPPDHLKVVMYQGDEEHVDPKAFNKAELRLAFEVLVYVIPREDDDETAVDTYCNLIEADMTKALMLDPHRTEDDGTQLAIDTFVQPRVDFSEIAGEFEGFVYRLEVKYRTSLDDPYQLAA